MQVQNNQTVNINMNEMNGVMNQMQQQYYTINENDYQVYLSLYNKSDSIENILNTKYQEFVHKCKDMKLIKLCINKFRNIIIPVLNNQTNSIPFNAKSYLDNFSIFIVIINLFFTNEIDIFDTKDNIPIILNIDQMIKGVRKKKEHITLSFFEDVKTMVNIKTTGKKANYEKTIFIEEEIPNYFDYDIYNKLSLNYSNTIINFERLINRIIEIVNEHSLMPQQTIFQLVSNHIFNTQYIEKYDMQIPQNPGSLLQML